MKGLSPTQRTLKALREQGAIADITERYIAPIHIRKDLFGFIDLIALVPGKGIVGVQCTSDSNRASHREKILTNEYAPEWLKYGGKIELWTWGKHKLVRGGKAERWSANIEEITITQYGNTKVENT